MSTPAEKALAEAVLTHWENQWRNRLRHPILCWQIRKAKRVTQAERLAAAQPTDPSIHTIDIGDLQGHVRSGMCWCCPSQHAEDNRIWLHRASAEDIARNEASLAESAARGFGAPFTAHDFGPKPMTDIQSEFAETEATFRTQGTEVRTALAQQGMVEIGDSGLVYWPTDEDDLPILTDEIKL